MLFNSAAFGLFFVLVVLLHQLRWSWPHRKLVLLISGMVFYGASNPWFLLILAGSALIDWNVARRIAANREPLRRKAWLAVSIVSNVGILCTFKYGNFLLSSAARSLALAGARWSPPHLEVILPVGISFYTFEALAYSIDVFRREMRPWERFADFGMFLSFFPHLVAGPILRPGRFAPQLEMERRSSWPAISQGLELIVLGLFEKVVLADTRLAPIVDSLFTVSSSPGTLDAWAATLGFAAQAYFDVAGYALCAIGVAKVLGFDLPGNFLNPYGAESPRDFWRRWHISLSSWLRDYLYIPLGGSRGGVLNTVGALIVTMTLGGLWHGAAWTFVAWGLYHGILLVAERGVEKTWRRLTLPVGAWSRVAGWLTTLTLVTVGLAIFRSTTLRGAARLIESMAHLAPGGMPPLLQTSQYVIAFGIPLALFAVHFWTRETATPAWVTRFPPQLRACAIGTMALSILLYSGHGRAFIYFQF